MNELETLARAKMYLDKLAQGINPLDDRPVAETDVVNNVRISRCLSYVSDVLRQVMENGGINPPKRRSEREWFSISQENLIGFSFSDTPIPISELARRINLLIDQNEIQTITHRNISDWLVDIGLLQIFSDGEGKSVKRPTEQGEKMGISLEQRAGQYGTYLVVLYNRDAQQFVLDNMDAIIAEIHDKKRRKHHGE